MSSTKIYMMYSVFCIQRKIPAFQLDCVNLTNNINTTRFIIADDHSHIHCLLMNNLGNIECNHSLLWDLNHMLFSHFINDVQTQNVTTDIINMY